MSKNLAINNNNIIIKVTKIKIDKIVVYCILLNKWDLYIYSYPFQTSPKATSVSESCSFQETAILFPGEVWIFLKLDNADGLCHLRSNLCYFLSCDSLIKTKIIYFYIVNFSPPTRAS